MAPTLYPRTPYTLTSSIGGPHLALATVGAVPSMDPNIPQWNPFARNDTRYRNIILVGQAADSELGYLANNPSIDFNPYGFATVSGVLDCQRLYDWLHPGHDTIGLANLVRYCFPEKNVQELSLHNAGNDAIWELKCCMVLLKQLADKYVPNSSECAAYPKVWDAIFVAMDVELLNAKLDRITELGFAILDSRHIGSIHDADGFEKCITARHIIIKKNVPMMVNGRRNWRGIPRYGNANYDTDNFDPAFGSSREVWINQVPRNANSLFFVPKSGRQWDWVAPAGLRPQQGGECVIQQSSVYWDRLVRKP